MHGTLYIVPAPLMHNYANTCQFNVRAPKIPL